MLPAGPAVGEPAVPDVDWDDEDEADDDRWPVTISLPRFGNRTVPHAFAAWVAGEGLTDQFDAMMCERHQRGEDGDPLEAFVNGRHDVPPAVTEAIAGFDDYLDQLFGPPVE